MDIPNRLPDYCTLAISEGSLIGSIQAITIDCNGNVYGGVGMSLGKSATVFTGSIIVGWISTAERPEENELRNFCEGNSNNVSGGFFFGFGRTYSNGMEGVEFGFFAPQLGGSTLDSTSLGSVRSFVYDLLGSVLPQT